MVCVQGWTTRSIGGKSEYRKHTHGRLVYDKREIFRSVGKKVDCPMNNVGQLATDMVKLKLHAYLT